MKYSLEDEEVSQSEHSPGIVNNKESLLRVIFEPEHIKDGKVQNTAISLEDLKERGFSVDREAYAIPEVVREKIDKQRAKIPEERQYANIARFCCGQVRQIKNSTSSLQAFLVIDSALPENVAHASIYSTLAGRGTLRKIRAHLIELLQDRYSYNVIFADEDSL